MRKSMIFQRLTALLFCITFSLTYAGAQNLIEPPEIKEALNQIIADARDSLKLYNNDPKMAASIKRARTLDSLANLNLQGEALAGLFRNFNSAYEKLGNPLRGKLKGEVRKKWLRYETTCAISGGKWRVTLSILDGVQKPPMFTTKKEAGSSSIKIKPEVLTKVDAKQRQSLDKPLEVLVSFPANGAYNMHPKELNGVVWGYMLLSKRAPNDNPEKYRTLAAKWTSNKGQTTYTYAEMDYTGRIDYLVPTNLAPGLIYKLDLLWVEDFSGLQNYWDASCFGGSNFFSTDLSSIVAEWVGVSAPLCSIYFRVSTYESDFKKLNKRAGKYDQTTHMYSVELDEPLDSLELYGNQYVAPRIAVTDRLSVPEYDRIFKPVVANYFVVPRTGKAVDTVNVNTPHPFEEAGLYNQAFVYKLDESRNNQLASISNEDVTRLRNGYVISGVGDLKPIIKIKGKPAPRITQQHFKGTATITQAPVTLLIESPKLSAFEKRYLEVRSLLQKRIQDRARFFYCMEVRHCKQTGTKCTRSLADFEKTELENLPPTIKSILNEGIKAPQMVKGSGIYNAVIYLPGSSQMTTSFSFDAEL